jgi:hypothetical protein
MAVHRLFAVLAFVLSLGVLAGCAQVFAPQVLSENYALGEGVESNHPAFIDGDHKTAGETTFPVSEGTPRFGVGSPPSEAYVLLPEARTVSKLVLYSDDLIGFDVLVEDPNQGWQFNNKFDGQKGPVITVPLRGMVRTTGVKIRVRRSAGDTAVRQRNVRGNYIVGDTRAPAQIYELEIYGPADPSAAKSAEETRPARDSETTSILMEGLK